MHHRLQQLICTLKPTLHNKINNNFIICIRKYYNSLGLMYRIISVYNDSIFLVITNISGYICSRVASLILYKYYINNNGKHSLMAWVIAVLHGFM